MHEMNTSGLIYMPGHQVATTQSTGTRDVVNHLLLKDLY